MSRVKIEDFIEVLKYHQVDVIDEDDEIIVWQGDVKRSFPIEDGLITKRFVQRVAQKFNIPPHHFFNPQIIRNK